jgi:hypothetical protein
MTNPPGHGTSRGESSTLSFLIPENSIIGKVAARNLARLAS